MRQHVVEQAQVADPEVRQGVVIDRDAAAEPAEAVVVRTQPVEGAGAADASDGGEQPQGDQDAGVGGRPAGAAVDGADGVEQRGEVEPLDEVPDGAGVVVGGEQVLQGHGGDKGLSVGAAQARGGLGPRRRR
jgi:hypothetical protein